MLTAGKILKTSIEMNSHRRRLGIATMFALVLVLGPAYQDAGARRQKPQPAVEAADLAMRIHTLINRERKKHRLGTLAWSEALARVAEKHSRDMQARNYLSHSSPEGKGFSDRYRQAGYVCEIGSGPIVYQGAENIALSHLYNSSVIEDGVAYHNWNSAQDIAQRTVSGWMKSPGHRKNILTPHWRQEGIGVRIEPSPGHKVYITQNFC